MSFFEKILELIYPEECVLCGATNAVHKSLCRDCCNKYASETFEKCGRCGMNASKCTCGNEFAKDTKTLIDGKASLSLTFYINAAHRANEGRITEKMIFALKSKGDFADFFASELSRMIKTEFEKSGLTLSDWTLTYAPRSVSKFYECGVDQGEEIAKRLSKLLLIKCKKLFLRTRSEEQKNLDMEKRIINASETIIIRKNAVKIGGKYLLFDDIITTGATITAAAKLLYKHGAAEVFPISIAKTLLYYDIKTDF